MTVTLEQLRGLLRLNNIRNEMFVVENANNEKIAYAIASVYTNIVTAYKGLFDNNELFNADFMNITREYMNSDYSYTELAEYRKAKKCSTGLSKDSISKSIQRAKARGERGGYKEFKILDMFDNPTLAELVEYEKQLCEVYLEKCNVKLATHKGKSEKRLGNYVPNIDKILAKYSVSREEINIRAMSDKALEENASLKSRIKELNQENTKAIDMFRKARNQANQLIAENEELQKKVSRLVKVQSSKESGLFEAKEAEISNLKHEINRLKNENNSLKADRDKWKNNYSIRRSKYDSLLKEYNKLKSSKKSTTSKSNTSKSTDTKSIKKKK